MRHSAATIGAGVTLAGLVTAHRLRNWGARTEETWAPLPGDELIDEPAAMTTRAVGIDAPAEEVWRWLVQIGQGRGGMYSYDWPPEHAWNAIWSFVLVPTGPTSCRLISRSRAARPRGPAGIGMRLTAPIMDPVTLIMTRKMLLGIKWRAEHHHPVTAVTAGQT